MVDTLIKPDGDAQDLNSGIPEGFREGWCILQLMGNRQIAGYATPLRVWGELMIRLTVPKIGVTPSFNRFYTVRSLYSTTPLDEKSARQAAERLRVPLLPIEREPKDQQPVRDHSQPAPRPITGGMNQT